MLNHRSAQCAGSTNTPGDLRERARAGTSALALLAVVFGLAWTVRAEEPVAPKPAVPNAEAQRLIDLEAATNDKLREETKAEVENRYQAGKRLFENLEYEPALKELNLALQLDRSNEKVRALLVQIKDSLGIRNGHIANDLQAASDRVKWESAEKLVELENRIDRAKSLMQETKDGKTLTPPERITRYENALLELERARELIKYMPYGVTVSEQMRETDRLYTEAERAIKSLRAEIDSNTRTGYAKKPPRVAMQLEQPLERTEAPHRDGRNERPLRNGALRPGPPAGREGFGTRPLERGGSRAAGQGAG